MKVRHPFAHQAGFTLVEMLVGCTVGAIISLGVFAFINTGSMLTARNLSVNLSSNSMRSSLDRVEQLIQQADTMPTLVDTAGAGTASTAAAGVRFDRYVGGPLIINPGALTLPSTTTSFTIAYAQAASPAPSVADVVRFDGTVATLRPRIAGPVTVTDLVPAQPGMKQAAVTLSSSLGATVTVASSLRARLVREVAVIVMPAGGGRQLRYYPDIAGTTNLNDATKYTVLTEQIGMQSGDATPFSLQTFQTRSFVKMSLRVRASDFDNRLLGRQADQFNTFAQVDSFIRPKINP